MAYSFLNKNRIWNCSRKLAEGQPREQVRAWLMEHEGLAYQTTKKLIVAAEREVEARWTNDELPRLRQRQIERHLTNSRLAMSAGDTTGAAVSLAAIDALLLAAAAKQP